ncbi:MAG: inorganic diphosphatase [Saprospiraceae bacterium]
MKNIYIIGLLVFTLISCKDKVEVKSVMINNKGGVTVSVKHCAGDRWDPKSDFLPLPMNIASVNGFNFLVLSDRLEKGKKLNVLPIGALRLMEHDTLNTYVIAIPTDRELKSIRVKNFDEFATLYSSVKWIIEQYMLSRRHGNDIKLKSWENENFAVKHILN